MSHEEQRKRERQGVLDASDVAQGPPPAQERT